MKQAKLKISALAEVIAVFLLVIVLFQSISKIPLSRWKEKILPGQKLYFLEYAVVLCIPLGLLTITRRDWKNYGITLKDGKQPSHVVAMGFLPVLALGALLEMVNWKTWAGSAIVSIAAVGVLVLIGWMLSDRENAKRTTAALMLFALAPLMNGFGAAENALIRTLYFYCFVGPAEEVLFRGYIQTRLNEVYGKPYRFFGVKWGLGLLIASVLFGLWHVAWQPLEASAWPHGMWTFFAGMIFGYVRERSRGVAAGSILHSVVNYLPFSDLFIA